MIVLAFENMIVCCMGKGAGGKGVSSVGVPYHVHKLKNLFFFSPKVGISGKQLTETFLLSCFQYLLT